MNFTLSLVSRSKHQLLQSIDWSIDSKAVLRTPFLVHTSYSFPPRTHLQTLIAVDGSWLLRVAPLHSCTTLPAPLFHLHTFIHTAITHRNEAPQNVWYRIFWPTLLRKVVVNSSRFFHLSGHDARHQESNVAFITCTTQTPVEQKRSLSDSSTIRPYLCMTESHVR